MVQPLSRPLRVHVLRFDYDRTRVPMFVEPFARVLPGFGPPSAYQRAVAGPWSDAIPDVVVPADLDDADVAVLPVDLESWGFDGEIHRPIVELAAQARAAGKVVLAFCQGDVEHPSPGPNCVMIRTSTTRRSLGPRDVVMPAWVADPADSIELDVRPWTPVPRVNFVGFAYPLGVDFGGPAATTFKWAKAMGRALLTVSGIGTRVGKYLYPHRPLAVAALRSARGIDTDIVLRQVMTRLELEPEQVAADPRLQYLPYQDELYLDFLHRLAGSDYTLSVRGVGNYSYRPYESLAVGRPVLSIRTDDVRPCAEDVPWDTVSVDVPMHRLHRLGPTLRAAHAQHEHDWLEVQQLCRKVWVDSLSPPGYFRRLAERVSALAADGALTPEAVAAGLA